MARFIFYSSIILLIYVYLGYPVLVCTIRKLRPLAVRKGPGLPRVTILIAAYNEEKCIEETLKNKLALDYPRDLLEIIVVSDGSFDRTERIVQAYESNGVRLIRQEPRAGKTAALNLAVPQVTAEVLVFSDANSIYEPNSLRMLVRNFSDPTVGYVTGRMVYANPDGSLVGDGCTAYMRYENYLREQESRLGSVVGVDGGIDAVRRGLYVMMNPDQLPDFVLPLRVVEQGMRVVYEPEAILREPALGKEKDEYRMRVRVALRALWALFDMRHLLSPTRYGIFAWQLWSHKVLRYLCFIFLLGTYVGNLALWGDGWFYRIFFVLQNLAYASAAMPMHWFDGGGPGKIVALMRYFTLLNLAAGHAFTRFLLGHKQVLWTPRKG